MRITLLLAIILFPVLFGSQEVENDRFIFFLHNRFLETNELNELHPEYGRTEYKEIISEFQKRGFNVISEKRNGNVNAREYAIGIENQIDSLLKKE